MGKIKRQLDQGKVRAIGIIGIILLLVLFVSVSKANATRKTNQLYAKELKNAIQLNNESINELKKKIKKEKKEQVTLNENLEAETSNIANKQKEYEALQEEIDSLVIQKSEFVENNLQNYKVDSKNQLTKEESVKALEIVKGDTIDSKDYKIIVGKDSEMTSSENIGNIRNSKENFVMIKQGIYVVVVSSVGLRDINHISVVDMVSEKIISSKAYNNLELDY